VRQQVVIQPQGHPGEEEQDAPDFNAKQHVDDQKQAPHPQWHFFANINRLGPRGVFEICRNGIQ